MTVAFRGTPIVWDKDSDLVTATIIGLSFSRPPSLEQFLSIGSNIMDAHQAMNWVVGDLLVYGEDLFGEQVVSQLLDEVSIDVQLAAITTCRAIPQIHRRADVPYSHHRLVTKYDSEERGDLLQTAARERLTLNDFRTYLKVHDAYQRGEEVQEVVQHKTDLQACIGLAEEMEGKTWTSSHTASLRFWLGL